MNCKHENMSKIVTDRVLNYKNKKIELKGINASKCENCGEIFLSDNKSIVDFLEEIKKVVDEQNVEDVENSEM